MKKFKITKVYIVEAADKTTAAQLLENAANQLNYLEYQSMTELPTEKAADWKSAFKKQISG